MISAKNFLVRKLRISNKEAVSCILQKRMLVNGQPAQVMQAIEATDLIEADGKILQTSSPFLYLAYYKPRGIETTLNKEIPGNLFQALNLKERVYPIGRLDKESEGLLLLTNDGHTFNRIIDRNQFHEKEYEVGVDKPLKEEDILQLALGIKILGKITRPAKVQQFSPYYFRIILTEGMNRQIRRMCYKLGYEVLSLKRTRIVNIRLDNLLPGEWRMLKTEERDLLRATLKMNLQKQDQKETVQVDRN